MAASVQLAGRPAAASDSQATTPLPALVHDFLLTPRGAERTFEQMAECWPGAPIATSLFDASTMTERFTGHAITTSALQNLPVGQANFRALLPIFPAMFERIDLSGRRLVVSSSSAFAHGVRPDRGAVHVCYCHSPFRYAWFERERALAEAPRWARPALGRTLNAIRDWDLSASRRVTAYIANSRITQARIADHYGRESVVIHPPVDVERFAAPGSPEDYFLYVGEVTRHKQVELTIEAARVAERRLVVAGDGPDRERLSAVASAHVEFTGRVEDAELERLFGAATALIVPNTEEFGIAAVEAMAAGRPVIARNAGGTAETVVDGVTGVLIEDFSVGTLAEVMREVDFDRYDGEAIAAHARKFSAERFRRELTEFVSEACLAGERL